MRRAFLGFFFISISIVLWLLVGFLALSASGIAFYEPAESDDIWALAISGSVTFMFAVSWTGATAYTLTTNSRLKRSFKRLLEIPLIAMSVIGVVVIIVGALF